MPFVFRDLDHWNAVLSSDVLKPLEDELLEKADLMIIGKILIPAMTKEGYDIRFSVAITASSSVRGVIILAPMLMILQLMILFPETVLWLPRLLMRGFK